MLLLVIFSILLIGMLFVVDPSGLLCASTLSSGILSVPAHPLFALALIPLFFSLRSRFAGFVLLAPPIVSAAMTFEAASAALVAAVVLSLLRYRSYLPFVLIAAMLVLVLVSGLPIAALAIIALLIPASERIDDPKRRIRAIFATFVIGITAVVILTRYVAAFPFELIGRAVALPIDPVLFAGLVIFGVLAIGNDSHASIVRSLGLFVSTVLFAELAFFALPIIAAVFTSRIESRLPAERLKGSRILALVVVLVSIVPSLAAPSAPIPDVDRALIIAPSFIELACEGKTHPAVLDRSGTLSNLSELRDPLAVDAIVFEQNLSHVIVSSDLPVVFAVEHATTLDVVSRGVVSVASRS